MFKNTYIHMCLYICILRVEMIKERLYIEASFSSFTWKLKATFAYNLPRCYRSVRVSQVASIQLAKPRESKATDLVYRLRQQ